MHFPFLLHQILHQIIRISTKNHEHLRKFQIKQKTLKTAEIQHFQGFKIEATIGFEPMHQGVADPRLTAWLCRHNIFI